MNSKREPFFKTYPKPYNYKKFSELTDLELKNISKTSIYSTNQHTDKKEFFNYEKSPVMDFYSLGPLDNLFSYDFSNGQDISYITSISDWSSSFFNCYSRKMEQILDITPYFRGGEKDFLHIKNTETIIHNFIIFNSTNQQTKDSIGHTTHRYLKFLDILAINHGYFEFFINDKEKSQKNQNLFTLIFDKLYESYKETNDLEYFARMCLNPLAQLFKYSRYNITETDPIIKSILPLINQHIPKLWNSINFIVKEKLFSHINHTQPSWSIVQNIISNIPQNDFFNEMSQIKHSRPEDIYPNALIYILTNHWETLNDEQFNNLLSKCLTSSSTESINYLLLTIYPIDKALNCLIKNKKSIEDYISKNSSAKLNIDSSIQTLELRLYKETLDNTLIKKTEYNNKFNLNKI